MNMPPYVKLANSLRKEIMDGTYGREGGLPGIEELARRSGLSINTVYKSLSILVGERIIAQRDRAYFVNYVTTVMSDYVMPIAARMAQRGKIGYVKNVSDVGRTLLPAHIADRLDLNRHIIVLQECVSGEIVDRDEYPMQLSKFYYFMAVSDRQIARMQSDASYDIVLECPSSLMRDDEIFTRFPTDEEAQALDVEPGTPVINILSTVFDGSGSILLFQDLTRVPSASLRYRYQFENRAKS